jgi:archaellum component FlaF (FlaF/FlaG flagellin family)
MDQMLIVQIVSFLISIGFIYGSFNNRIKNLEKKNQDDKDIKERLTRIEEQTKILLDHFIKK